MAQINKTIAGKENMQARHTHGAPLCSWKARVGPRAAAGDLEGPCKLDLCAAAADPVVAARNSGEGTAPQARPGEVLGKHRFMLRSDRDPDAEQDATSAWLASLRPVEAPAPVLASAAGQPRLPALWLRLSVYD